MFDEFTILALSERIKTLEDKVFKNSKKTETPRAQQILLLKHSGLLEKIKSFGLSKKDEARFLSILLNRSSDNIEDDLRHIDTDKSPIITKTNYDFIVKTFKEVGLNSQKTEAEAILVKIQRKQ